MAKIAVLLPEADMVDMAERLIHSSKMDVVYLKAIHTVDAVNEARLAAEEGAHIIIARGYQARLIKEYTNIPLVEIQLHAQEIGLLIKKAKAMVKKEHPVIGLIAYENMLSDLSHMEELMEVTLRIIYLTNMENIDQTLHKMAENKPDIIIGGEVTCGAAQKMGYPTLFYQSTEESLKEALKEAKNMAYAADNEKQNTAQFETVLDTSFNGIIKVNSEHKIIVVNKLVENLIGRNMEEMVGLPLEEVFPQIDMEPVKYILMGERESYTTSINIRNQAWMLLIAPIQYDESITGAILSLHKISDTAMLHKNANSHMVMHGFTARTMFQDIHTENRQMKEVLEDAKIYALSDSPVMIYGQSGLEDYMIAEAVHNNSTRKAGPYVSINIKGMEPDRQMEELFEREAIDGALGSSMRGAMIKADRGTIFIRGVEHLTLRVQQQILRTLLSRSQLRTDAQPLDMLDVRIIGVSKASLSAMVKQGQFSEELYYLLQGLVLNIPSLNQRKEDLDYYFRKNMERFTRQYNKPVTVTEGGYQKLHMLPWNGNIIQVRKFCERLVISAKKRTVDEAWIEKLFLQLYPHVEQIQGQEKVVIYQSPEGARLAGLLEKHHGSRSLAAKELGISTTTLWRRMKKYGIEAKYNQ